MKKRLQELDLAKTLSIVIAGGGIVLIYLVCSHLSAVLGVVGKVLHYFSTFLTGLVIAYIINPLAEFFSRTLFRGMKNRRSANTLSVILTILVLLGVLALLISTTIPQLVDSVSMLASNLTNYYDSFEESLRTLSGNELLTKLGFELDLEQLLSSSEGLISKAKTWLTDNLSNIAGGFIDVGTSLVDAAIAFIISIYLLLDWRRFNFGLRRVGRALFSEKSRANMKYIALRSDYIIKGFVRCNLLDALIIGVLNFIVMIILGMPYSMLISFMVGVTNIIPTFGPIIGYVPCALILVLINPWQALWFTILTVLLQTFDAYVVKPLIFKDAVGLPPLWVLVSILVGARIGGILGMLIAMPFTGILAFLLEDFLRARLEKKEMDDPVYQEESVPRKRRSGKMQKYFRALLEKRAEKQAGKSRGTGAGKSAGKPDGNLPPTP